MYRHDIKDTACETEIIKKRLIISGIFVIVLTLVLVARFYYLQVAHYMDYLAASDKNRIHLQAIAPVRGQIYDVTGNLLAGNRPTYNLSIVKEYVDDLASTITRLRNILSISDDEVERFYKKLKGHRVPLEAIPIKQNLSDEDVAKFSVDQYLFDGVHVEADLVRYYPFEKIFTHSVGYVGRINRKELSSLGEIDQRQYQGTNVIGKVGVEKQYERLLHGEVGVQHVETNSKGIVQRVIDRSEPLPGKDLVLFINSKLQQVAHKALEGRRGAVVAVDVNTGGVLAMVSTPSYDPNQFVSGISFKNYKKIKENPDFPLFNRVIQGRYPAASTIKPMLGLAALHNDVVGTNYTIDDPGYYQLQGSKHRYRDWKVYGHGHRVNLNQAIVESCDTYFYDVAFKMGIDMIHSFGQTFGLGLRTGIDVPNERNGLWPSPDWKLEARKKSWFPGDTLNVGIGQGDVLVTPLQLAVMASTLATRGVRYQPRLVKSIGGKLTKRKVMGRLKVGSDNWDHVINAMVEVVHSDRGTAKRLKNEIKYKMAGKTGTGQVVSIAQGEKYNSKALKEVHRDHALFIGFAPVVSPEIAVGIIVENAEHGSSAAAPIARKIFDSYLEGYQ